MMVVQPSHICSDDGCATIFFDDGGTAIPYLPPITLVVVIIYLFILKTMYSHAENKLVSSK